MDSNNEDVTGTNKDEQLKDKDGDVERLNDLLSGAYIYDDNGEWDLINDVEMDGKDLVLDTESVRYTAVPCETRQQAYDSYNGKAIIVHPNGIDVED